MARAPRQGAAHVVVATSKKGLPGSTVITLMLPIIYIYTYKVRTSPSFTQIYSSRGTRLNGCFHKPYRGSKDQSSFEANSCRVRMRLPVIISFGLTLQPHSDRQEVVSLLSCHTLLGRCPALGVTLRRKHLVVDHIQKKGPGNHQVHILTSIGVTNRGLERGDPLHDGAQGHHGETRDATRPDASSRSTARPKSK